VATAQDLINRARLMTKDASKVRYPDATVLDHLNDLLRLARRQRPDLWIGQYTTPLAALTLTGTFPLSPQYEDIFVLALVAYCDLREEEYSQDGRTSSLMSHFQKELLA